MAKKLPKQAPAAKSPEPGTSRPAVTPERFRRLHRLLSDLGAGPKTRDQLTRALEIDVRGFYRDLELLRAVGIAILLSESRYSLGEELEAAKSRLPFPDAHLSLGDVQQLSRGKAKPQARLRQLLEEWLK